MCIPSDAQLRAFGAVIYEYAAVESGLKMCLSGILDIPLDLVLILTEPYSADQLRRVIKSVVKDYRLADSGLDKLVQIVGDIKPFGPLRNLIAHSRWTDGTRPGSIKPRGLPIRRERAVFYGDGPDERDWTAKELESAADKLRAINLRIVHFSEEMGLTARIERHMSSMSSSSS
jgi:hypothetical protein